VSVDLSRAKLSFQPRAWLGLLRRRNDLLHTYAIAVAFVILVALVTIGNPAFLSPKNLANMLGQWAPAGIMAVALTYVIIARGFDLSLSSGFSLCAIMAAATAANGHGTLFAFLAAITAGLAIGLLNALLVCGLSINPFIATVGAGFIFLGLDIVATPNASISVDEPGFDALGAGSWYGIPYKGMILIVFMLIGGYVLAKSRYGQYLYAIGGNPEASRLSGLRVRLLTGSTYVFSGLSMGVAGMLAASQLSSAQAQMEPTIVFDVFAIVVLGGTSLAGGYGAIWRTAVGLAIIATISNGFNLLDINPFYQNIVKGSVIIAAVAFEGWARRLAAARLATDTAADASVMQRQDSSDVPDDLPVRALRRLTR
jgi:ribose transport system permease protein